MKLTAITITGDRPEAFALCERYVGRQTRQPDQWIVVDDGIIPTQCTKGQQYIRRTPRCDDPSHTLTTNLREAMKRVRGDAVIFSEDDDWQSPLWYASAVKYLKRHDLFGEGFQSYYHIGERKYMVHENTDHAALGSTAFRRDVFWAFNKLLEMSDYPWIDTRLWSGAHGYKNFVRVPAIDVMTVSIKGLPGRRGMGLGHQIRDGWKDDEDGSFLCEIIGHNDAMAYERLSRDGVPCLA